MEGRQARRLLTSDEKTSKPNQERNYFTIITQNKICVFLHNPGKNNQSTERLYTSQKPKDLKMSIRIYGMAEFRMTNT